MKQLKQSPLTSLGHIASELRHLSRGCFMIGLHPLSHRLTELANVIDADAEELRGRGKRKSPREMVQ